METHSSILAWRIPWTEEPGGLQSTGSYWRGLQWPPPGDLPDPGIESASLTSALADGFFTTGIMWEALETHVGTSISLLGGE